MQHKSAAVRQTLASAEQNGSSYHKPGRGCETRRPWIFSSIAFRLHSSGCCGLAGLLLRSRGRHQLVARARPWTSENKQLQPSRPSPWRWHPLGSRGEMSAEPLQQQFSACALAVLCRHLTMRSAVRRRGLVDGKGCCTVRMCRDVSLQSAVGAHQTPGRSVPCHALDTNADLWCWGAICALSLLQDITRVQVLPGMPTLAHLPAGCTGSTAGTAGGWPRGGDHCRLGRAASGSRQRPSRRRRSPKSRRAHSNPPSGPLHMLMRISSFTIKHLLEEIAYPSIFALRCSPVEVDWDKLGFGLDHVCKVRLL